jgi:hypothetical protein
MVMAFLCLAGKAFMDIDANPEGKALLAAHALRRVRGRLRWCGFDGAAKNSP